MLPAPGQKARGVRQPIRRLIERLDRAVRLPEPIYDFGALLTPGKLNARELFADREFVGCDARPGPGVDRLLALHALDLPDASVATAISTDTFEHVERFWTAIEELHRVLQPGGILILTSVMYFPIHNYPSDYWRFTPAGFRALAHRFDHVLVEAAGVGDFPHTIVLIAVKGRATPETLQQLESALRTWRRRDAQSWKEICSLWLPPILLAPLYRWFTRWTERRLRLR